MGKVFVRELIVGTLIQWNHIQMGEEYFQMRLQQLQKVQFSFLLDQIRTNLVETDIEFEILPAIYIMKSSLERSLVALMRAKQFGQHVDIHESLLR